MGNRLPDRQTNETSASLAGWKPGDGTATMVQVSRKPSGERALCQAPRDSSIADQPMGLARVPREGENARCACYPLVAPEMWQPVRPWRRASKMPRTALLRPPGGQKGEGFLNRKDPFRVPDL